MASSPSRVFAALLPHTGDVYRDENILRTVHQNQHSAREVQVTGSAEISCSADRAKFSVSVSNSKETVNDVTNSVSRRVEYILQTLRQHNVKEEELSVRRQVNRTENLYTMEAQVTVVFSDFVKMERVCVVLLEKLDQSVDVSQPHYYHSQECLSLLRRRVCVAAVENARLKASEVCVTLGQTLGLPLLVREEETTEMRTDDRRDGALDGQGRRREDGRQPCLIVTSRVVVSFNLRPKERTREKL